MFHLVSYKWIIRTYLIPQLGLFYKNVGILTWWYFWWVFVLEGGYCIIPDELYLTKKMSEEPELVFPSNPPSVEPVT